MSDPIQIVPTAMAVPRVTPVRHEPPVEPAKKPQTDNRSNNDRRDSEREAAAASDRRMSVTRDENAKAFVYRSIEADSGEVVWQYPAEVMLRRAEFLRQFEEKQREEQARELDERA